MESLQLAKSARIYHGQQPIFESRFELENEHGFITRTGWLNGIDARKLRICVDGQPTVTMQDPARTVHGYEWRAEGAAATATVGSKGPGNLALTIRALRTRTTPPEPGPQQEPQLDLFGGAQ